ncbi:MAG: hypothetical protein K0R17_2231 [Rariglobus sp.]|jgi:hypothetical protein|nr:hypothetical protein [Rariglobus sp.]
MKSLLVLLLVIAPFVFAQETPPAPEPYTLTIGDAAYIVLSADAADGYRVQTPAARVIGIPAADATQPLTVAALTTALATPPTPVVPVPTVVTRRQLFLWLNTQGHTRAALRSMLEAIPDATAREAALIEFDEARDFARTHPLINQLATALGFTSAQVDAGFTAAAAL